MCGIAGTWSADGRDACRDRLARMIAALRHRGPDDQGMHVSGGAAIGMTRLSIIDPAGGHQPISSEDGQVTVVCNGEIYNHLELRRDLEARGHRFTTRSDVEVIVHLYEEHGVECLQHLRGMFALAVWDARRATLLLILGIAILVPSLAWPGAEGFYGIRPVIISNVITPMA